MPNQVSQQIVRRMEIHRRHHGDEVANLLRIERRKAQAEGATLAYSQQVDRILPATLAQGIHAMVDIAVDIIRQAQFAVGGVRIAPIDQVDIQTGIQQTANHGTVFLQIHHIGAVDQGVDDEQRHRMRLRHPRLIAIQRQLVFLIDRLPRGYAGLDLAQIAQGLATLSQLGAEGLKFLDNPFGCQTDHEVGSPRAQQPSKAFSRRPLSSLYSAPRNIRP